MFKKQQQRNKNSNKKNTGHQNLIQKSIWLTLKKSAEVENTASKASAQSWGLAVLQSKTNGVW